MYSDAQVLVKYERNDTYYKICLFPRLPFLVIKQIKPPNFLLY